MRRMRGFDRFLVLGSLLHAGGSWVGYRANPELLVWALSGSVAGLLLAWVGFAGGVAWVCVALGFGFAIGNPLDPRALIHAVNAALLCAMSIRTIAAGQAISAG